MEKKNLDFISDPFEHEYLKKMEIIEKMTPKSQASESSGHNDGNFNNFNEYNNGNYEGNIQLY